MVRPITRDGGFKLSASLYRQAEGKSDISESNEADTFGICFLVISPDYVRGRGVLRTLRPVLLWVTQRSLATHLLLGFCWLFQPLSLHPLHQLRMHRPLPTLFLRLVEHFRVQIRATLFVRLRFFHLYPVSIRPCILTNARHLP